MAGLMARVTHTA
ncbi:hypothetical protein F383_31706 [Gossypium arboreum]|uniref:Uncharacterized protein n=1 Tax=Gossypium arboreum TaxID=29729 RepID=A0A0B0PBM1_GOSAR|nr:hypothetical protein F383_31706 [Gossypium arboreum]